MHAADDIISFMSRLRLIAHEKDLEGLVRELSDCPWVGMDTEFLRKRTYYPVLCLIQIHSPYGSYGIDPLKIKHVGCLESLLRNLSCIKIMHSCRQDIEALEQRMDARMENLFDTQLAAGFCGYDGQVSYARLVNDLCGVKLDKAETRTDWSRRPLADSQIRYALDDVRYLDTLCSELACQLEGKHRMGWFREECEQIVARRDHDVRDGQAWMKIRGREEIPPVHQGAACALAEWREQLARRINLPREWVLSSQALAVLCTRRPDNIAELRKIGSLSRRFVNRSGGAILALLEQHPPEDRETPVWGGRYDLQDDLPGRVKLAMARLREVADEEQISAQLLANRKEIEQMIRGRRDLAVLAGWRYELLGRELLECFT